MSLIFDLFVPSSISSSSFQFLSSPDFFFRPPLSFDSPLTPQKSCARAAIIISSYKIFNVFFLNPDLLSFFYYCLTTDVSERFAFDWTPLNPYLLLF